MSVRHTRLHSDTVCFAVQEVTAGRLTHMPNDLLLRAGIHPPACPAAAVAAARLHQVPALPGECTGGG